MEPIDTSSTDIEEVIILRKAKRLGSNFREGLSTVSGRAEARKSYIDYYDAHPIDLGSLQRVLEHIQKVYPEALKLDEEKILERGYF